MSNDGKTPQQLNNIIEAFEFWMTVSPEEVVPGLRKWTCGTQACFGGHLAKAGMFGLRQSSESTLHGYYPSDAGGGFVNSETLFGCGKLFCESPHREWSDLGAASDHEVIMARLFLAYMED